MQANLEDPAKKFLNLTIRKSSAKNSWRINMHIWTIRWCLSWINFTKIRRLFIRRKPTGPFFHFTIHYPYMKILMCHFHWPTNHKINAYRWKIELTPPQLVHKIKSSNAIAIIRLSISFWTWMNIISEPTTYITIIMTSERKDNVMRVKSPDIKSICMEHFVNYYIFSVNIIID